MLCLTETVCELNACFVANRLHDLLRQSRHLSLQLFRPVVFDRYCVNGMHDLLRQSRPLSAKVEESDNESFVQDFLRDYLQF